jgi:hypothetical protein
MPSYCNEISQSEPNTSDRFQFHLEKAPGLLYAAPHNPTNPEIGMWKGLCAGAIALATVSTPLVTAEAAVLNHSRAHAGMALRSGAVTSARIAHAKAVLKLTPAQARQWAPVEAALRAMLRQEGGASVDSAQMVRLTSAAMPLIMSLDENQKRDARRLARSMGLEQVASLF